MTKWSWYHVKTSELEKLSSIIPRDVTSYFSQFVKKISSPCENGLYVITKSNLCIWFVLYDQDKKDAKIQKFLHYFVAHGILITVQEKEEEDFQKLIHNFPMGTKIVIVPLKDYVLSYQCLYLIICERLTTLKTISEMYYGIFIIIIT